MDTKVKLENDLKDAMRSGDDTRKRTIRMVLAAIKQTEIDKQVTLGNRRIRSCKEVKTRRRSLEGGQGRPRHRLRDRGRIVVLNSYLPNHGPAELTIWLGCDRRWRTTPTDMGKGKALTNVAGRAANDLVSQRGLHR
jgi:uncharacterized protein YqeY